MTTEPVSKNVPLVQQSGSEAETENLPASWSWSTLGEVAEFFNGDRSSNYPKQADFVANGIPFVNTGHIDPTGRLALKEMDYISRECFDRLRGGKLKSGDIVYCLRGSTIGKIARVGLDEGTIASSLVIIRPKGNMTQDYLYYFLSSAPGQRLVRQHDNGSAQPNLSVQAISRYPLPLPPVGEQREMVALLNALDDKIEQNRRTGAKLEGLARAVFKAWFVDFEPVKAKAAGATAFPGMPAETFAALPARFEDSELGPVPAGWLVGRLGDLLDERGERVAPSPETVALPYVPIDCITTKQMTLESFKDGKEAQSSLIRFNKGDVLFGAMRPYFHKVCLAPFAGTTRTTCFVLVPRSTDDRGFSLLLASEVGTVEFATTHSVGSTIPYAKWQNSLCDMPCVMPPETFRRTFNEFVEPILHLNEQSVRESTKLAELRDYLLPRLLSGRVRVGAA